MLDPLVDSGGNGGDRKGNFMVVVTDDGSDRRYGSGGGDGDGCLYRGYSRVDW